MRSLIGHSQWNAEPKAGLKTRIFVVNFEYAYYSPLSPLEDGRQQ
jgi:hypothetical protein